MWESNGCVLQLSPILIRAITVHRHFKQLKRDRKEPENSMNLNMFALFQVRALAVILFIIPTVCTCYHLHQEMIEVTKKVVLLYSEDGQDETIWRYLCMHAFVCIIHISLHLLYKLGILLWNYSLPLTLTRMHTLSHLNIHTCTKWEHRGWCPWGRRRSKHIWWSLSQTRPPGSEPDLCCWRPGCQGRLRVSTKIIKFNPSPYFIPRNTRLLYRSLDASAIWAWANSCMYQWSSTEKLCNMPRFWLAIKYTDRSAMYMDNLTIVKRLKKHEQSRMKLIGV